MRGSHIAASCGQQLTVLGRWAVPRSRCPVAYHPGMHSNAPFVMQEGAMLLARRMADELVSLSLEEALPLTRALGHYLGLTSIAELHHKYAKLLLQRFTHEPWSLSQCTIAWTCPRYMYLHLYLHLYLPHARLLRCAALHPHAQGRTAYALRLAKPVGSGVPSVSSPLSSAIDCLKFCTELTALRSRRVSGCGSRARRPRT